MPNNDSGLSTARSRSNTGSSGTTSSTAAEVEGAVDYQRTERSRSTRASLREHTRRRKAGLVRKLGLLTDLLRTLDRLFYAELCAVYYMEASLPRLLLRLLPHVLFFSPVTSLSVAAQNLNVLLPVQRPHLLALLLPNLLCAALHLFGPQPTGTLHGGVLVDFVGQTAPGSRWGLLWLDLCALLVQVVILAAQREWHGLRREVEGGGKRGAQSVSVAAYEAEESGALREDVEGVGASGPHDEVHDEVQDERSVVEDIELQSLPWAAHPSTTRIPSPSRARIRPPSTTADLSDLLRSGNAYIADLHLVDTLFAAVDENAGYGQSVSYSLQQLGYHTTLAAIAAEGRRRVQGGPGGGSGGSVT